jgi:carboxylesterase
MEPMAVYLREQGITTTSVTLPGHGTSLHDFALISSQKLIGTVEREFAEMKEACGSVVVVGFSMGGLLAIHLATLRDVEGLVTICTPVFPRGGVLSEHVLQRAARFGALVGANIPKFGITSLSDKTLRSYLNGYNKYPSRSILCLLDLMKLTRPILKRVTAPLLVVHSQRDDVIWRESGNYIFRSVASAEKRYIVLENSRHKAPLDRDRCVLFEEVTNFCLSRA